MNQELPLLVHGWNKLQTCDVPPQGLWNSATLQGSISRSRGTQCEGNKTTAKCNTVWKSDPGRHVNLFSSPYSHQTAEEKRKRRTVRYKFSNDLAARSGKTCGTPLPPFLPPPAAVAPARGQETSGHCTGLRKPFCQVACFSKLSLASVSKGHSAGFAQRFSFPPLPVIW